MVACAETATLEELQAALTEARAALSRLVLGKSVRVIVDQNGERVEYNGVSIGALKDYIRDLERRMAALTGCASPAVTRPMRFVF